MLKPSTIPITINLNRSQYQLLLDTQNKFEQLFDTHISLEDVFLKSLFFTNNTNTIKLAILDSYEEDNTIIANELSNKTVPTSNNTHNTRKKRKIPLKKQQTNQISLGGF